MSYQNRILKEPGYHEIVRDKIGLDEASLPNTKIDRMDALELAETKIIEMVPDYASLTGDDVLYLKMAAIYCICALLANDFSQDEIRSEKLGDYQYEVFQQDMADKEKDFWVKVGENLAMISTYDIPDKKLVDFGGSSASA